MQKNIPFRLDNLARRVIIRLVHTPTVNQGHDMGERVSAEAKKYYDERFIYWVSQGEDPGTASEKADMDLLEWSQPLPLPRGMDFEELWT